METADSPTETLSSGVMKVARRMVVYLFEETR